MLRPEQISEKNKESINVQSFFAPIDLSLATTYVKSGLTIYYKYRGDYFPYHGADANEEDLIKLISSFEERFSKDRAIPKLFINNEDRRPNINKIQATFKDEIKQALDKEEPEAEKAVKLLLSWGQDLIESFEEAEDISLLKNIRELTVFIIKSFDNKMIDSLLGMMKETDFNTSMHSASVMLLTINFLNYLKEEGISWNDEGGPEYSMEEVVEAAFLHDLGKKDVADEIILKPDQLTDEEFKEVQTHSLKGYLLAKKLGLSKLIREVALLHHRRVDGSGYPDDEILTSSENQVDQNDFAFVEGESGEVELYLSFVVQIISIVDVFDAARANRVYKKVATTVVSALSSIKNRDVENGLFSRKTYNHFVKSLGM